MKAHSNGACLLAKRTRIQTSWCNFWPGYLLNFWKTHGELPEVRASYWQWYTRASVLECVCVFKINMLLIRLSRTLPLPLAWEILDPPLQNQPMETTDGRQMNQTNTTYRYRTGVIDETAHTLTLQQFNISQINVQFLLLLTWLWSYM